jgi:type II secretion system (T2SS) protein C
MTADSARGATKGVPAPWPWRIAAWIATLAALGALAYAVAYWGWRWLGPEPHPLPRLKVPEHLAPAILAVPLFGRADGPPTTTPETPAALQGDTRLLGVFAGAGGTGHALFRLPGRGSVLVRAGEEIAKDVTLLEVRPDGVRIRDRGETREFALRTAGAATTRTSAPAPRALSASCGAPAGYTGPVYRLNAELLTGIAARPEGWTALLTPGPGGLAVREGSGAASMLGMKPGDSLAQANGIALRGIDDILVAFVKPLIASQPVLVAGMRDGKPAAWLFVNAGACPG